MRPRVASLALVVFSSACAEGRREFVGADAADVGADVGDPDVPVVVVVDRPPMDIAGDHVFEVSVDLPDLPDAMDAGAADVTDAPGDTLDVGAEVAPDVPQRRVDYCYLTEPPVMEAAPGAMAAPVGVAVFVAGVTTATGRGADVSVEVGVGPGGTHPLTSTAGAWTWGAATYDRDIDGSGATGAREYDRYQLAPSAPRMVGEYAYAARARVGSGPWTACDLVTRAPHEYNPAFAGRLTVVAAGATRVTYCNLQFPRTLSVMANMLASMPVYGRAYAAGLTNRGCANVPTGAEFSAQLGYGLEGSYPSHATWTWIDGTYSSHRDSNNPVIEGNCANIEYRATPRAPVDCSTRSYAWRFKIGGGPWTYCRWAPPAEGAPTTPAWDTYVPALAGTMTVTGCL